MNTDSLYGALLALESGLRERVRAYLEEHGLDEESCRVLGYIGSHGGCRSAQLMAALRCERAPLNRRLSALGARGLIRKRPCKADSRAYTLCVTPAGRAVLDAVEDIMERWSGEMRALLGDDDYASLSAAVQKLAASAAG